MDQEAEYLRLESGRAMLTAAHSLMLAALDVLLPIGDPVTTPTYAALRSSTGAREACTQAMQKNQQRPK